jgi:hypothetical protein
MSAITVTATDVPTGTPVAVTVMMNYNNLPASRDLRGPFQFSDMLPADPV